MTQTGDKVFPSDDAFYCHYKKGKFMFSFPTIDRKRKLNGNTFFDINKLQSSASVTMLVIIRSYLFCY